MKSRKYQQDPSERGVSQSEVQPWTRLGGVEHICELRKSSQVLYSIFVTILRMMYSGKKGRTFGCPDVVWKADSQKTELWIDTELRWEDQRPDFTPAIFVSLGEIKYDFYPTMDQQARLAMSHDGERHYERIGHGTAQIVHVSDKAGAACSLADNTENYMSSLQDPICDEYCFDHFSVVGRIPRQQKEQAQTAGKGRYLSVVAVQFDFTDAWDIKFETPILKAVSMVDFGSQNMDENGNPIGGVRITGTNVDVREGSVEIEFGNMAAEKDVPLDA